MYIYFLCTPVTSDMNKYESLLWELCINISTWVCIFFIEACLDDRSVTRPSVHTLHDSSCLSVPLKWSCLVRETVKGRGWGISRNAVLCALFVKINHLYKDIWREFILNSCKSKLLCLGWWCRPHCKPDHFIIWLFLKTSERRKWNYSYCALH